MNKEERRKDVYYIALYVLIMIAGACSIFAQLPDIIAIPLLKNILTYVPWVLVAIYLFLYTCRVYYTDLKIFILPGIIIVIYVLGKIFDINYKFNYLYTMLVATFILLLGILLGINLYKEDFNKILYAYVICVIIFSVYIYFVIFKGVAFNDAQTVKLEGGKNSSSIIILSGIVLLLYNDFILKRTKYLFVAFMAFLIILIKSRTAMVCCLVALIAKIFIGTKSLKSKIIYIVLLLTVYLLLMYKTDFYDIAIKKIFLKDKELKEENLNEITSTRTERFKWLNNNFNSIWLLGVGIPPEVLENFYYYTVAIFGVFGSVFAFAYALSPLYFVWKDRKEKKDGDLRLNLFIITVVMLVGGIGEALCPFGPGVKCYLLWLMFGYYIGHRNTKSEVTYNKAVNNNSVV